MFACLLMVCVVVVVEDVVVKAEAPEEVEEVLLKLEVFSSGTLVLPALCCIVGFALDKSANLTGEGNCFLFAGEVSGVVAMSTTCAVGDDGFICLNSEPLCVESNLCASLCVGESNFKSKERREGKRTGETKTGDK